MRLILALFPAMALAMPAASQAAMFRCKDANGAVSFQQQPCAGSATQSVVTPSDPAPPQSGPRTRSEDPRRRPKLSPRERSSSVGASGDVARWPIGPPPGCRLPWSALPERIEVLAATSYGQSRSTGFPIDQSGSEAQIIDVVVNAPGRSVALMLGFTLPTIWNVKWTEGTDIRAVWTSGPTRNVVAGLPRSVPVLATVRDDKPSPCGTFVWGGQNFEAADKLAMMAFGRPALRRFRATGTQLGIVLEGVNDKPPPPFVIGDPYPAGGKTRSSGDVLPASFRDPLGERVGTAGVRALVRAGTIRPARRFEYTQWIQGWLARQDVPPIDDPSTDALGANDELASTFVVNRAMELPALLSGGHSATFIVPAGVPVPEGELGHSAVLDVERLTCMGVRCPDVVKGAAAIANRPLPKPDCRWPWTQPVSRVYAVAGGAGVSTGMSLPGTDKSATFMDVIVNAPGQDVALMLAVYGPRVWNVRWTRGTRIAAVYASGYELRPVVRGLRPGTPLLATASRPAEACPAFLVTRETLTWINPFARAAFGKAADLAVLSGPVDRVYVGPRPADETLLEGGAGGDLSDVLTGGIASPVTVALNEAVARGVLRRATRLEEIEYGNAWRRMKKLSPAFKVVPSDSAEVLDAFVVLKPFEFPGGIADSVHAGTRFIVPRGVKPPTGDRRGVAVLDWNTLPQ